MVTRNFKNTLALLLQASPSAPTAYGMLPITDVSGVTYYNDTYILQFPYSGALRTGPTLYASEAGISIGTGGGAESEYDYNLESTITSGIALSVTEVTRGCDSSGDPFQQYKLTCTNDSGAEITVREIGYKQKLMDTMVPGSGAQTNHVYLLDRTVLPTPVTIAAGDAGVIYYKLKTNPAPHRTIGGVDIVSWTWGTDEQIAAMIAAAQNGDIDLQSDAGWHVGDIRLVEIGAFTGGNGKTNAAQSVPLVISSFEEYEGCGNVMQFDFRCAVSSTMRMNATNTNVGGYGASEMKTVTIPALVAALPNWLGSLLKTFSVKVSAGNQSSTIETVSGNKLALRSQVEVAGTAYASASGEGSLVDLYRIPAYQIKIRYPSGGNVDQTWLRSPVIGNTSGFCISNYAGIYGVGASASYALAPFGCL